MWPTFPLIKSKKTRSIYIFFMSLKMALTSGQLIRNIYACSVTQSCLDSLWLPWTSLPGSSVHGITLARILEWVVISSSRGSSRPRYRTCDSCGPCIGRQILYPLAAWEAPNKESPEDKCHVNEKPQSQKRDNRPGKRILKEKVVKDFVAHRFGKTITS